VNGLSGSSVPVGVLCEGVHVPSTDAIVSSMSAGWSMPSHVTAPTYSSPVPGSEHAALEAPQTSIVELQEKLCGVQEHAEQPRVSSAPS
jgi:hypothetical protein